MVASGDLSLWHNQDARNVDGLLHHQGGGSGNDIGNVYRGGDAVYTDSASCLAVRCRIGPSLLG